MLPTYAIVIDAPFCSASLIVELVYTPTLGNEPVFWYVSPCLSGNDSAFGVCGFVGSNGIRERLGPPPESTGGTPAPTDKFRFVDTPQK